jgi:hypothetical protein
MDDDPQAKKRKVAFFKIGDIVKKTFKGFGFCIFMFDFAGNGRMNYLSNCKEETMLKALKEFIAVREAAAAELKIRTHAAPRKVQ